MTATERNVEMNFKGLGKGLWPRLLVVESPQRPVKHFLVPDEAVLSSLALALLRELVDSPYHLANLVVATDVLSAATEDFHAAEIVVDALFEKAPESSWMLQRQDDLDKAKKNLKMWKENLDQAEQARLALDLKDGQLAWNILMYRKWQETDKIELICFDMQIGHKVPAASMKRA